MNEEDLTFACWYDIPQNADTCFLQKIWFNRQIFDVKNLRLVFEKSLRLQKWLIKVVLGYVEYLIVRTAGGYAEANMEDFLRNNNNN